jgi:hypothetical protein
MKSMPRNAILTMIVVVFLIRGNMAFSQFGIIAGAGVSEIAFLNEGQVPYLGYEANALIHNFPAFSHQVGISRQFNASSRFAPLVKIILIRKGLNYNTSFLYDDIRYQLHITYLELPLLLKINTDLRDKRQSGINLGPYISLKINATLITDIEGVVERQKINNVNRWDTGIMLGYSFDLGPHPRRSLIDLRTSYSLINMMSPVDGPPLYDGPEYKYARNVSIMISYEYYI